MAKKTMTFNELITFGYGLKKLGELKGVKLAYAISKNIRMAASVSEDLRNSIKQSQEYRDFVKKRTALQKDCSEKDALDRPVTVGNEYVIGDQKKFDGEYKRLEEEYGSAIAADAEAHEEYSRMLQEDIEVEMHMVSMEWIPDDISAAEYDAAFEMILDDPERMIKK